MKNLLAAAALVAAGFLAGCGDASQTTNATAQSESERLAAFFEDSFDRDLVRSPMNQSYLGIKDDYDKWDDLSEEKAREDNRLVIDDLARLHGDFDFEKLNEQAKLSYRLFEYQSELELARFPYRFHGYPVNQMRGWQSRIPAFLINIHRITSESDAEAYVARLDGVKLLVSQVIDALRANEKVGIVAPEFVFAHVLSDSGNMLKGAPFEEGAGDSTLLADFKKKVGVLELPEERRAELVEAARKALVASVGPAYRSLIDHVTALAARAPTDDGVWRLPDGGAYYKTLLRQYTTTAMTADEIHDLGLAEVARIQGEMTAIMEKVSFEGSLNDFYEFTRTDERFYYPNTEQGKADYLERATGIIETMKGRLDEMFLTKPKADIVVKAVEAFREKSAGKAFYQRPAPDGSRPGTYYANLFDTAEMPTYQMAALAYHEGIPGHHMQIAIVQELENLPRFRRFGGFTAYIEGWGLYSEYLPKEMGFYQDPYADFGRLAMELWRACRLVVDTGIHDKKWSREKAIEYLAATTPNPRGDVVKAIERYIVFPGQATAYKIGMLKILELREATRARLGENFDVRKYHDAVLRNGALPLSILEEVVATIK